MKTSLFITEGVKISVLVTQCFQVFQENSLIFIENNSAQNPSIHNYYNFVNHMDFLMDP